MHAVLGIEVEEFKYKLFTPHCFWWRGRSKRRDVPSVRCEGYKCWMNVRRGSRVRGVGGGGARLSWSVAWLRSMSLAATAASNQHSPEISTKSSLILRSADSFLPLFHHCIVYSLTLVLLLVKGGVNAPPLSGSLVSSFQCNLNQFRNFFFRFEKGFLVKTGRRTEIRHYLNLGLEKPPVWMLFLDVPLIGPSFIS